MKEKQSAEKYLTETEHIFCSELHLSAICTQDIPLFSAKNCSNFIVE